MYFLILINFLIFSLGQLVTISRSTGGFNIYFFDIFLFFTNIFIFFYIYKKGKFEVNFPLLSFLFFVLFSFSITVSNIYFYPLFEQVKVLAYLMRFSMYFIFGYLLYTLVCNSFLNKYQIKKVFEINFYFLTILNILQIVLYNNLIELAVYGWDPHIGRLTGTFLDPNFMAFYLCLYFILNHFYLKNSYIEYISMVSILLTLSRNGIITLIIIYIFLNIKNLKKMLSLILISCFFLIFNPRLIERFVQFRDSNDSSYVRVVSWVDALKVTSMTNFSGVGFNNYKNNLEFFKITNYEGLNKNSSNSTDSSILHVLVTLGPLGVFLIAIIFVSFLSNAYLLKMNIAVLFSLIFNSQFINSLFFPQISILLFVLLFLGLSRLNVIKN